MNIYIVVLFITFICSLKAFRLHVFHYRVIAAVIGVDLIVEMWTKFFWEPYANNMTPYNIVLLAEFWLYAFYYLQIIRNRGLRKAICVYLAMLPLAWIVLVVVIFPLHLWNSHFCLLGSVATVLLSTFYYYQLFTAATLVRLSKSFEFWVATALIIYWACDSPYVGMLNFLTRNFKSLANGLLSVHQVLNIVFYSIIAYAFICATPIEKSS